MAVVGDQSREGVLRQLRESGDAPLAILFTPNRQLSEHPRTLASPAPFEPESAYLDALSERSLRLGDFMVWFNSMERLPGKGQIAGGRTLAEVRNAAGHANVSITSAYLHVAVDDEGTGNLFGNR